MKQHVKRMAVLIFAVLTVGSMSIPAFANAREVTETNHSQAAVQEPVSETPAPSSAESTPANPVEEIAATGAAEETAGPPAPQETPAPKGNLSLVDEVIDQNGASKQFVTLVSKNGNYFYLIIDRDEKGNTNVYYLNQVDERDLFDLMDEKEAAGLREDLAVETAPGQQAGTLPVNPQEEPEATTPGKKTGALILVLVFLAALGGGAAFFFLKGRKTKEAQAMIPDPDADYEEEDEADDDPDNYDFSEDDDFGVEEREEDDGDVHGNNDEEASD